VTCHDPHKNARATTTAQYESKCLNCHAPAVQPVPGDHSQAAERGASGPKYRACPVDRSKGCIACHMPQVRIDSLHLNLTDHHIRIHPQN
jgi:hypothetical protein